MAARTCGPRASDGWPATGFLAVCVASLGDHVRPIVFSSPVEGSSMRCTHAVLLASAMVRSARCGGRGPSRPEAVCTPCARPALSLLHVPVWGSVAFLLFCCPPGLCVAIVSPGRSIALSLGAVLVYTMQWYATTPHVHLEHIHQTTTRDEMQIQNEQE